VAATASRHIAEPSGSSKAGGCARGSLDEPGSIPRSALLGAERREIRERARALGLGAQHVVEPAVPRLVAGARRLHQPVHHAAMRLGAPRQLACVERVAERLPRNAQHFVMGEH